jgi:hypothetical protein
MRGYPAPWAVAGGWAIELALETASRSHGDVDLAAFRADQGALRAHLHDWRWECVGAGAIRPWPAGEWLASPVHELYAVQPGSGLRLEFLLNERDGENWVYRRDARIRLPLLRAVVPTAVGLPALAPEIALLYKAKSSRADDEVDFAAAAPRLDVPARAWLADALVRCYPGHPWILALGAPEA